VRRLVILLVALPLFPQKAKPAAPAVVWTYESPRGFHLLEPSYRFPSQIKQALVLFVQPVPALSREYQAVFLDKRKFVDWFRRVLVDQRARTTKAAKSEGTVLSSDLSKLSAEGGTILSTAGTHSRRPVDPNEVEPYLQVLKIWGMD
jgi:hypothetical protein